MNKKIIFITGGSGFIGRNLYEYLSRSYHVLAPTHKELELTDAGAVERFFKRHRIDTVIHCAIIGGSRKEEQKNGSMGINLRMFMNVVRCRRYFYRFIHCGSGAEYDKGYSIVNVKEEEFDTHVPIDEYGFYKYLCVKYIDTMDNAVNLRIFGLFGPYENYRLRFISNAICRTLFGLPITMNQDTRFDYVYIKDFVRIVEHFIVHTPRYRHYNIGTGNPVAISTLAAMIASISYTSPRIGIKKGGMNNEYTCSPVRLREALGKFSFTPLPVAAAELYDWYRKRKRSIKYDEL